MLEDVRTSLTQMQDFEETEINMDDGDTLEITKASKNDYWIKHYSDTFTLLSLDDVLSMIERENKALKKREEVKT